MLGPWRPGEAPRGRDRVAQTGRPRRARVLDPVWPRLIRLVVWPTSMSLVAGHSTIGPGDREDGPDVGSSSPGDADGRGPSRRRFESKKLPSPAIEKPNCGRPRERVGDVDLTTAGRVLPEPTVGSRSIVLSVAVRALRMGVLPKSTKTRPPPASLGALMAKSSKPSPLTSPRAGPRSPGPRQPAGPAISPVMNDRPSKLKPMVGGGRGGRLGDRGVELAVGMLSRLSRGRRGRRPSGRWPGGGRRLRPWRGSGSQRC